MVQIDCIYVGGCHKYQDFVVIETDFLHVTLEATNQVFHCFCVFQIIFSDVLQ